ADVLVHISGSSTEPGDDVFVIMNVARRHPVDHEVDSVVETEELAYAEEMRLKVPGLEAGCEVVSGDAFGEKVLSGVAGLGRGKLSEAELQKLAASIAPR